MCDDILAKNVTNILLKSLLSVAMVEERDIEEQIQYLLQQFMPILSL
mgnify:FL=1